MKFYYMPDTCRYFAKMSEAAAAAREHAKHSYHDVAVEQVDVGTDKDNLLRVLNHDGGHEVVVDTVYVTKGKLKGKAQ